MGWPKYFEDSKILEYAPSEINSSIEMIDEFLIGKYNALILRNTFKFWPKTFAFPIIVTLRIIRYDPDSNRIESGLTYSDLSIIRRIKMIYEDNEIQRNRNKLKRCFHFIDSISPLIHSLSKDENENVFYELRSYYQINIMTSGDTGIYGWFDHQYGETTKFLISHIMWYSYRPYWFK